MTQFGQALGALLTSRGVSLRNLEATTAIDHTTLSRLMKDQRPSHSQLRILCAKACGDDAERYQLLLGHLRDEIAGAGLEVSRFALRYQSEGTPSGELPLPPDLEASMNILGAAAATNPTLSSLLADLSALVTQQSGSGAATKVYAFPEPKESKVAESPRKRPKRSV
jgi:transcriptional regulator with XRE-family HTH domain